MPVERRSARDASSPSSRYRVLLIDDDDEINLLHRRVLEQVGGPVVVETAPDGRAGLELLRHRVSAAGPLPHLILLDINMPRWTGFDFLEGYESLPASARSGAHLVVLTTSVLPEDRIRALAHEDVRGFRSKPLSHEDAGELLAGIVLPELQENDASSQAPTAVEELVRGDARLPLSALEAVDTAAWVCMVEDSRVVWANRRGLEVWRAASLEALRGRDWNNNTPAVRAGVRNMWEVARREGRCPSRWTLHPAGEPVTVDQVVTAWKTPDGREALLVEARVVTELDPDDVTRRRAEVLRYAPTPIAMLDERGVVATCNPAFLEDFAPDGRARLPLGEDDAERLLSAASENRRIEFEQDVEHGGASRSYLIRCDPAVDPVTSGRAAVVSFTDLSDMARHRRALAAALHDAQRVQSILDERRREVERSNRDLEAFAHVASHDLKAPVRRIASFAELLREECGDNLGEFGREYVDLIVRGCGTMDALLSGLLEFSSVGRDLKCHRVALDDVLADALAMLELRDAEIDSKPLPEVVGDRAALVRVFTNLLGNALKFRGEMAPRIEISAVEKPDAWEVSVQDNGIGFTPEEAALIFAPFRRLHGASEYEGSGLGLSIVRRILEAHDGHIEAHGQEGAGAKFVITLPKG
ncbi:MAG: ATP-binding protein [Nannocystaceae bacterium]|nr:ATP-binding protein [bacterium]